MANNLILTQSTFSFILDGARDTHVVTMGTRNFLYAAAVNEDTIAIYELFSDGTVSFVGSRPNDAAVALNGVSGFESITTSSGTFLYAVSEVDDSLSVFEVAADGSLSLVQTILDDATLELELAFGELTIAQVGGNEFLITQGYDDDGFSVFQIASDGTLTNTANIDNAASATTGLNGAAGTEVIEIDGTTFLYVTAALSDAVNVFELMADGTVVEGPVQFDTATTRLNGAREIEHIVIGGRTFVFIAAESESAIGVFEADNTGALTPIFNVDNSSDVPLGGAYTLEVFTVGSTNYLAAGSRTSDSLNLFEINADGSLNLVDTVTTTTNPSAALDDVRGMSHVEIDGADFLITTSLVDDGLSIFRVLEAPNEVEGTSGPDFLLGTELPDSITGLDGDDVILAQGENDIINAGEGSDTVSGGDGDDMIDGDGNLSRTASDSATITETGQDLALTVTLPDTSDGSTIEVSGLINREPLQSEDFNIVYVIDVSGSMGDPFVGLEAVGDLNNDGEANTLIDGTISAFQSLNDSIVDAGFTGSNVSIVSFNTSTNTIYSGSVFGGVSSALATLDSNGGTNFEVALQTTISLLNAAGPGENQVYFLSDGDNNSGGSFTDEVATLIDPNGLNADITAIGLGDDASLPDLDLIDDGISNNSAVRVLEPSALTSNLTGSPVQQSEVDRLDILVNGVVVQSLDGSQFSVTPLGLQYDATVGGLSTTAGDVIEVVLVASDTAETEISVSLTVPNAPQDPGDDLLLGGVGEDTINGNAGNDSIFGGSGNDALNGGTGNDLMEGESGNDALLGGFGDDTLIGGAGLDTLRGGSGNDVYYIDRFDSLSEIGGSATDIDVVVSNSNIDLSEQRFEGAFESISLISALDISGFGNDLDNLIEGNGGDNRLDGRDGADTVFGGGGNDTLNGGEGDDVLASGDNNDTVFGDDGNDEIFGGNQSDYLSGGDDNDTISGGDGNDTVLGGQGSDSIFGGNGADELRGGDDADFIAGNLGNDTIFGGDGGDSILAGDSNDTVYGNSGQDTLEGGNGADVIYGGDSNDTILGGNGNDFLNGDAQNDSISGEDGNDTLRGGNGNDTLIGADGNDSIVGGSGSDELRGGDLNDTIVGNSGMDMLFGGNGVDSLLGGDNSDTLYGNAGMDVLNGGLGADSFYGGFDADTFDFNSGAEIGGVGQAGDRIFDFDQGNDLIDLVGIDALDGVVGNQAFTFVGTAAHSGAGATLRYVVSGSQTFIYGDTDADGGGDFALVLEGTYTLTAGDFIL